MIRLGLRLLPPRALLSALVATFAIHQTGRAAYAEEAPSDPSGSSVNTYYGVFNARVPIPLPAFHNLEPAIALSYSSAGQSTQAGVGWTLDGFSVIERTGPGKGAPRYDSTDLYFLDGQELFPCASGSTSPSCTTGGTHSTRIENYQRIRFDAAANTWTVTRKDGTRLVFTALFPTYSGATLLGTFRWGLSSITDTSNNTVSSSWWCDGSPALDCYPDSISYNGYGLTVYRETRPDPVTFSHGGTTLGRSSYRLKSLLVTAPASTRVRGYRLSYTTSSPTGRSLLGSIQQYGRDVVIDATGTITGGTALPAQTLGWQSESSGFAGASNWVNNPYIGSIGAWTRFGDFNGDGKTDMLQQYGYDNYVYLSTGTSLAGPVNWVNNPYRGDPQWTQFADFNGDGKIDMFQQYGYNTYVYLSTGSGFAAPTNWAYNPYRGDVAAWTRLGDFNGDGKTDMLQQYGYDNYVYLSTGSGFAAPVNWVNNPYRGDAQWTQFADFNGDGKTDMFQQYGYNTYVYLSTGSGFAAPTNWAYNPYRGDVAVWTRLGDFNGDGKTDMLQQYSNDNYVFLSTGSSFTSPVNWVNNPYRSGAEWTRFGDFNGDGKTDMLQQYYYDNYVYLSNGNGFTAPTSWAYNPYRGDAQWTSYVDLSGDGKLDMLQQSGQANYVYRANAGALLLTTSNNGLGGTTTIGYTNSSAWPNTYLPLGTILPAVSSVQTCDGRGNCSLSSYSYQGGLWSAAERRFLGYRKVTTVLDAAGNYTETYYHQHVGCIAKPEVTYYRNATGSIYKYSTFDYSENAAPPYTSLMTNRWEYECNLSASCQRALLQIGYDQYGNGYLTYEYGNYDTAGDERTALRGMYPNTSAYVVGLPAYENIYSGIGTGGTLLKQTLHEYDGNTTYAAAPGRGLVTRQQAWNNQTGGYSTRRFAYDAWGNRTSETDELGAVSTTSYDPTYHVHPTQRCNAVGLCSTKTWDSNLDLIQSETDSNGNTTSYTHDALGRPLVTTLPSGSTETFAYLDWGNPALQRVRRTVSDGTADGLWSEIYEDGLGRRYKTVREGNITEETLYNDGSTRIWKKSAPYAAGETPQYQVFSFDGIGRLRTITNPDGTVGQRVYGNGYIITYDELNREKVTYNDAYGQTVQVREKNGTVYQYTTYQYDMLGNLTQVVDAAGNATTVTWDSLGRKLTGCDPDTGCSSYTYDAAGRLLSVRDAKGQLTSLTYDAAGRRLTKTLNDGRQMRWTYDELGHGAGKGTVTSTSDSSGSESRVYDHGGRLTALSKCISGVCYTMNYAYDAAGRLSRITYPDGEAVPYTYDAAGRLSSVGGYVTGFGYNGRGQLLAANFANGTSTTYSYNAARQWLTSASVAGPGGAIYQASYTYDAAGQVASTSSTTHSLSNLSYGYDTLGRVTSVGGSQTQTLAYNALGNVTSNSAVGTYQYADTTHRHAVTTAGSGSYVYDSNGLLTSGGGMTLTWDSDNRLTGSTVSGSTTSYSYDAAGQRVMVSGSSGTTRYFGPMLEAGPSGLTKIYYAGPLAVARRDATGVVWLHQDRLGSVRALSDATGQRVASYEYGAFGALVAQSGTATAATNRRFGAHIADPSGLLYMNARYYHPLLGRFISPDTVVPDASNPQALNRYVYVLNNPISNTDPSGHVPVVAAVATALSVGVASGFAGTAFVIAVVGAATVTAGYVLKDPLLTTIGSVLLGAASGFTFGAGFLGDKLTLQAAFASGGISALTSPISPLDPKLKQVIGYAYTAQSLLYETLNVNENVQKGADQLRTKYSDSDLQKILNDKASKLGDLPAESKALLNDPSSWKPWQRLYGEAVERITDGALSAAEAIALNPSGGLVGPGDGFLAQVLDVTTGWIPGIRVHSVLHDAAGFLVNAQSGFGVGPGYLYLGYNFFGLSRSLPLAGQVEGIAGTGGASVSAIFPRWFE